MERKYLPLFLFAITLVSCTKKLDTTCFTIDVPRGWEYKPESGSDSFIGTIKTPSGDISFDYSTMGYANSLTPTEEQYLADQRNWASSSCYFCEAGVTYVPKEEVEKEKQKLMAQPIINGAVPVKIESNIEYTKKIRKTRDEWKRYYPGSDYIADLKYKDSTIYIPIRIPESIKKHYIKIDTTDKYIIKTIYPQPLENGTTGIYIKSRTSKLNFNMVGEGLSPSDQEKALAAFKTIKLKQ